MALFLHHICKISFIFLPKKNSFIYTVTLPFRSKTPIEFRNSNQGVAS